MFRKILNWFKPKKPTPEQLISLVHANFTREGFIEWVKTKDPNETYSYGDSSGCAVSQYLRSLNVVDVDMASIYYDPYILGVGHIVNAGGSYTFGGILERHYSDWKSFTHGHYVTGAEDGKIYRYYADGDAVEVPTRF
jgi:hypothetical protein